MTGSISNISPNMGTTLGNTNINITGAGFGSSVNNVSVMIDGIAC